MSDSQHKMPPAEYVTSGRVRLAVYRWGAPDGAAAAKEVVVLVHGYPDSAAVWQPLAGLLSEQYEVVAYDVRGAGASSKPKRRRDFRLSHLRDDLAAVLDAVSPDRPVHLVAYDWGAPQAWEAVFTPGLPRKWNNWSFTGKWPARGTPPPASSNRRLCVCG